MKKIGFKLLGILITLSFLASTQNVINLSNPVVITGQSGLISLVTTTNDNTSVDTNADTNADSSYLGKTATMNPGSYGSRATVTFTSETQIDITKLYITRPPDALFYLGYGGSASDYVNRGKIISEVFKNKNNDSLTLSINPPLNELPYTHIAIICRRFSFMINPGIQYKKNKDRI